MPSERSERIISHAARRAAGSKPVVGSSRKTSSGSPTSATPRSRRRFWPPESVFDARVALLLEPDERDHLVDVARLRVVAGEHRVHLAHGERSARAPTAGGRRRSARGTRGPAARDRGRAPSPRRRRACGSPRGSRPSSSCRRRSGRAGRRPRPPRSSKSTPRTASSSPYDFRRPRTTIALTRCPARAARARRAGTTARGRPRGPRRRRPQSGW